MKKILLALLSMICSFSVFAQSDQIVISNSHGYEMALGWWGWSGGSKNVSQKVQEAAEQVIQDTTLNHGFEYDAVTWQMLCKYNPIMGDKVRQAIQNANMEIVGGTFAQPLCYMIGTESNVRQMLYGTRYIKQLFGKSVDTYSYQEFQLYPQMPYVLDGVGIKNSFYENHLGIAGRLKNTFIGNGIWKSNDGSSVRVIANHKQLLTRWNDAVDLVAAPYTIGKYFNTLDFSKAIEFNPSESDFYFDAGGYTSSYGNMASILNCNSENRLLMAERFATLSFLEGGNDFSQQLENAWKTLLASQNHDIMYCGSEAYGSEVGSSNFEGARYLRNGSYFIADEVLKSSLEYLAVEANTQFQGDGVALVIFNPIVSTDNSVAYKQVNFPDNSANDIQIEYNGQPTKFQILKEERYPSGCLKAVHLVVYAENLPSLGYRVYNLKYLNIQQPISETYSFKQGKNYVENRFFKLKIDKQGRVYGIYDKQQSQLILGSDESFEPESAYDRTLAYRFRNTFGALDLYKPLKWEVLAKGPVLSVVCSYWESKNAYIKVFHTLYEYLDRIDMRIEYTSKNANGDLMDMSPGEKKECLWLDFLPTEEGNVMTNTVADFNKTSRDNYYSNSWVMHASDHMSFTVMHKGIHSWHKGYTSQVPRDKREWTLSADLAITMTEWVPGMLRFNQEFSNDNKALVQEFSILSGHQRQEYENELAVNEYYFNPQVVVEQKHKGKAKEMSYLSLDGEVILNSLYFDMSSNMQPILRLWNPLNSDQTFSIHSSNEIKSIDEIKVDGRLIQSYSKDQHLAIQPVTLKTVKLNVASQNDKLPKRKFSLISSSVPYHINHHEYVFDSPMEALRFNHQFAKFSDSKGNVYMITDPYEEINVEFNEIAREQKHRIWKTSFVIPEEYKGSVVRLILSWKNNKPYGVGTCILTDDYSNRVDEPVTLFVNGKQVENYSGDITDYLNYGDKNEVIIKVFSEDVPLEILKQRPSVVEYGIHYNAGNFGDLISSKLRIGKKITSSNIKMNSDAIVKNNDFSRGLQSWSCVNVKLESNGVNQYVSLPENANLTQTISIIPGNYYLMFDFYSPKGKCNVHINSQNIEFVESFENSNSIWDKQIMKFVVPEGSNQIQIKFSSSDSNSLIDNIDVISNKVAENFIKKD